MRVHVKICGITDIDSAWAAVDAGADALGFVFAPSPRQVTPELAAMVASQLPGAVECVAVFRRPDYYEVRSVLEEFPADFVQADRDVFPLGVEIRALPVFREGQASMATPSTVGRGRFLYEGRRSGVGETVDWQRARVVAEYGQMSLAGGLNPTNVEEAIRVVRPFGVDVSSGVESQRGVKDPLRIRAFVDAVRKTEKEMVTR